MVDTKGKNGAWSHVNLDDEGFFSSGAQTFNAPELFERHIKEVEMRVRLERTLSKFLKGEVRKHIYRLLSDAQAKEEILNLLKQAKMEGKTKISVIDIMQETNLPPQQISSVMARFEQEGKIREEE